MTPIGALAAIAIVLAFALTPLDDWLVKYLGPRGSPGYYLLFIIVLPLTVIEIVLVLVDVATENYNPELGIGLLSGIFALVALIPTVIVYIKRFHDRDKSGWWVLVTLIPIIGAIWILVELGFLKGTPGPNRFGPPVTV